MPARKRHREQKNANEEQLTKLRELIWKVDDRLAVPALVNEIFSPARTSPLIVTSTASDTNRTRVNVDDLVNAVGSMARVAVVDGTAIASVLSESLTEGEKVYGGATRIFWPASLKVDPSRTNPLFLTKTEDDSPNTIKAIVRELNYQGFVPLRADSVIEVPWQDDSDLVKVTDVGSLRNALAAAKERAQRQSSEIIALRKQVRSLNDQIEELQTRLHGRSAFRDPVLQFRHEVEQLWLHTYNETDRERYPLVDYTLGANFLASVDSIEGVERDKIVATAVDVLTRRAWEMNGRKARQMRESEAAGSGVQVRSKDQATAWRCNVQTNTASARRFMWWEIPDGTIELASVSLHDDFDMPR